MLRRAIFTKINVKIEVQRFETNCKKKDESGVSKGTISSAVAFIWKKQGIGKH